MDKVYTHFQTETTQKPYDLYKGVPLRVWNNSITAFEQWFNFICWIFFWTASQHDILHGPDMQD